MGGPGVQQPCCGPPCFCDPQVDARCCCAEDISISQMSEGEKLRENRRRKTVGKHVDCGYWATPSFSWKEIKGKTDKYCTLEVWECATAEMTVELPSKKTKKVLPAKKWADKYPIQKDDWRPFKNFDQAMQNAEDKKAKLWDTPYLPIDDARKMELNVVWGVFIQFRVYSAEGCECKFEMVEAATECCIEKPKGQEPRARLSKTSRKKRYKDKAPKRGTKPPKNNKNKKDECSACE